jgi:hypothetical protein
MNENDEQHDKKNLEVKSSGLTDGVNDIKIKEVLDQMYTSLKAELTAKSDDIKTN